MLNENAPHETRAADRGARDRVLVPLHENGDKPPLFFVPAGYGGLRLFRRVADLIDSDRPVFGLQPPRAGSGSRVDGSPLHGLVQTYVSAILHVQPTGPYSLAGYSSGGLLTAAIAQQLILRSAAVDLLFLLDPPLKNPWWVNVTYLGLSRLCNLNRLTDTIRWAAIRRWDSLFFRCISDEGLCTHIATLREHEAAPYPGRIVFFRPRRSWIRLVGRTLVGRSWRKIAQGGLEVHRIPGSHNEMLRGRQREIVAEVLRACLKRSEDAGPAPTFRLSTSCKVLHHGEPVYSALVEGDRIDEVFDWESMDRLHRKGLIPAPEGIARSAAFVEAGLREAAAIRARLFSADDRA